MVSSQSLGLRNGENHLLFSLLPRPEFNHRRAMLAASGLSSLEYRLVVTFLRKTNQQLSLNNKPNEVF